MGDVGPTRPTWARGDLNARGGLGGTWVRKVRKVARITSYNVCYTKLLRFSSLPAPVGHGAARGRTFLDLGLATIAGRRVVLHDLAFEDPDLDADDPIGGRGFGQRT